MAREEKGASVQGGENQSIHLESFLMASPPMFFNHFTSLHLDTDYWQKGCASANKPDTALKKIAAYMKLKIPREMKVQSQKVNTWNCMHYLQKIRT